MSPRAYARRYPCVDCGAIAAPRPGVRCGECSARHRAERNKRYQPAYHAIHRPSPVPRPQPDPALPPMGALVHDDDGERVQCHVCGRFYGSLPTHIRTHGLDADAYKARFGLARGTPLWSAVTVAKQRAAALARDQAAVVAEFRGTATRPVGVPNRLQSRIASCEHSAKRRGGGIEPPVE